MCDSDVIVGQDQPVDAGRNQSGGTPMRSGLDDDLSESSPHGSLADFGAQM